MWAPARGAIFHSRVLAYALRMGGTLGSVSRVTFLGAFIPPQQIVFQISNPRLEGTLKVQLPTQWLFRYHLKENFIGLPTVNEWSAPEHRPLGNPSHCLVNGVAEVSLNDIGICLVSGVAEVFLNDIGICLVKMSIYPVQAHNLSHWKKKNHLDLFINCAREVFPKDRGISLVNMSTHLV